MTCTSDQVQVLSHTALYVHAFNQPRIRKASIKTYADPFLVLVLGHGRTASAPSLWNSNPEIRRQDARRPHRHETATGNQTAGHLGSWHPNLQIGLYSRSCLPHSHTWSPASPQPFACSISRVEVLLQRPRRVASDTCCVCWPALQRRAAAAGPLVGTACPPHTVCSSSLAASTSNEAS